MWLMSTFAGRKRSILRTFDLLAAFGSLVWLALILQWFRGISGVPLLKDFRKSGHMNGNPALSVIVAARDEERSVRASVGSMLAQEYSGSLEVVAVDDRSNDRTGEILDELATKHPGRLRVFRVGSLPDRWLGKTHALQTGALEAAGEWLLFTDADVTFSPDCCDKAVRYAVDNRLDHLTLSPAILCRGVLLRSFVLAFSLVFEVTQRPWRVSDQRTKEHVGVGAFNLIKKDVYQEIGTHHAIRMRPDDDMKLAKLVKLHGFRQGVAYGTGLVSLEWHQSLRGAVRGLSKSLFAGLNYRFGPTLVGVLMLLLTNLLPAFGLFSRNTTRILCALSVLSTFLSYAYRTRISGDDTLWWYAVLHPIGVSVFIYAVLRSAFTTIIKGGIEGRETHYPLEELRDNAI